MTAMELPSLSSRDTIEARLRALEARARPLRRPDVDTAELTKLGPPEELEARLAALEARAGIAAKRSP